MTRAELASYCEGHPCEDDPAQFPHAAVGETFYCDGRCAVSDETFAEYVGPGADPDEADPDSGVAYAAFVEDIHPSLVDDYGDALDHGAGGGDPDEGWL